MKYFNKLLLFTTMVICLMVINYAYAANSLNSSVPSPILGVELGDEEVKTVNAISQSMGKEPTKDYLDYEYFDRGRNVGGSKWSHIYVWVFNESVPDAYISVEARKGKVVSIVVNQLRCQSSTGVWLGDTVDNFVKSFPELPYNQDKPISPKSARITYKTDDIFYKSFYKDVFKKTVIWYNYNTRITYKMESGTNETYIGESPYTSREVQLGSSNYSRDGIKKRCVAG